MTKALERAFDVASKLPEPDQDALATLILEEIEAERRWDRLLEQPSPTLARMAEEALAEHRAGLTELLDPDKL